MGKFLIVGLLVAVSTVVLTGCQSGSIETLGHGSEFEPNRVGAETDLARIEEQWGVKVQSLRQSAAGYMLDFRFRVIDPKKAGPLLSRKSQASIVVEKSGATLAVPHPPKIGALRTTTQYPKKDRNYFVLFANPGRYVAAGDQVTVMLGEFKAEHLTVQ